MKNRKDKIDKIEKKNKGNRVFTVLIILLLGILAGVLIFVSCQEKEPAFSTGNATKIREESTEKWQESEVIYQGHRYQYNQKIKTYLIMGIDKSGPVQKAENAKDGGQADAIFLLVVDESQKKTAVIFVHRNTMTEIETYTEEGMKAGKTTAQICTQHGFGDGKRWSCNLMVNAVSKLFYELPIKGYLSLRLDAIPIMNDAVGGVEVTVLEDVKVSDAGVSLREGQTVTLNGTQAYYYLRGRDIEEFDSATKRLTRQEQYIEAYTGRFKEVAKDDPEKAYEIYDEISPYVVTNIDFPELMEELTEYGYAAEQYSIPGQTIMGEKFEEFYVDEEALYELILKIFYEEVTE